jgi:hypothetical protein
MFDQLFESFRKVSESSLQAQQDMFRQWVQQWPSASLSAPGISNQWNETIQKRSNEGMTEALNKHREWLDSTYKSGISIIEQTFRISEAKSPEDYRRLVDGVWHTLTENFKEQSEAQFRELQKATEKWLQTLQSNQA